MYPTKTVHSKNSIDKAKSEFILNRMEHETVDYL